MAFFPTWRTSLAFSLLCLGTASCGGNEITLDEEPIVPDEGTAPGRLDASKPSTSSPSTGGAARSDASASSGAKADAGTGSTPAKADAASPMDGASGNPLDGLPDLGGLLPTPADGGTGTRPGTTTGSGTCDDKTPHGCFTPAPGNPAGCPKNSPEIPLGLPSLDMWDLCNGGAVGAGATCSYNGPGGDTASCLCDTGVHWLCVYL
jgi:hypothetical protein